MLLNFLFLCINIDCSSSLGTKFKQLLGPFTGHRNVVETKHKERFVLLIKVDVWF